MHAQNDYSKQREARQAAARSHWITYFSSCNAAYLSSIST
jgi:hypothetical protein